MCISFRRYVSKLYSDFRKGTREKELNVRIRSSNFCDIANFASQRALVSECVRANSSILYYSASALFCTELDLLREITNHRQSLSQQETNCDFCLQKMQGRRTMRTRSVVQCFLSFSRTIAFLCRISIPNFSINSSVETVGEREENARDERVTVFTRDT